MKGKTAALVIALVALFASGWFVLEGVRNQDTLGQLSSAEVSRLQAQLRETQDEIANLETSDDAKAGDIGLAYVALARTHMALGSPDKARSALTSALAADPKNKAALSYRAELEGELGNRAAVAEAKGDMAAAYSTDATLWLEYAAAVRAAEEDKSGAIGADGLARVKAVYDEALGAVSDKAPIYAALARAEESQGNIDEAIKLWRQAALVSPEFADAYAAEINRLQTGEASGVEGSEVDAPSSTE